MEYAAAFSSSLQSQMLSSEQLLSCAGPSLWKAAGGVGELARAQGAPGSEKTSLLTVACETLGIIL